MPFAIGHGLSLFGELERPQALRLVSVVCERAGVSWVLPISVRLGCGDG